MGFRTRSRSCDSVGDYPFRTPVSFIADVPVRTIHRPATRRVDRETGTVTSIEAEHHYTDEDRPVRRKTTVEEWETDERDRPEEYEPVGPLAWAWRVAYY